MSEIFEKKLGKIVAAATVSNEIMGRGDVPAGRRNLVDNIPKDTRVEAIESEAIKDGKEIEDVEPSSCTITCDKVSDSSFVFLDSPALAMENRNAK